jgi:hypothetical protein
MTLAQFNFDPHQLLANANAGQVVAGCLITVFIIAALIYGFFEIRKMGNQLHMLDEDTRARRAHEEALCSIGSAAPAPKQQKDPWAN